METFSELEDEFDAMIDFELHLEFNMDEIEEADPNEITWQDLCQILTI